MPTSGSELHSEKTHHPADPQVIIIGAGPAGLTAAFELARHDIRSLIVEKDSTVGGLARTAEYKGYLFDIGGHRFFTKVRLLEQMWRELLGADFITRPRLSRIYYKSKFFQYPLEPFDALRGLGFLESLRCGLSFLTAKISPTKPEQNFEDWVSNRFGKRLFRTFFKTYTEKVWGIPCREIQPEWAAQRIRGLSLTSVLADAIGRKMHGNQQKKIKSLIHEFEYPRRGPGMMWKKAADSVTASGSQVVFNAPVEAIRWEPGRVTSIRAGGREFKGTHFISSMPIRELIHSLDPQPPEYLRSAADDFKYRDFLTVALIVRGNNLFPDNWIYVHDPAVRVGRIQNYNNWSPEMVPEPNTTCLGLEYFCFENDSLWSLPDKELIERARNEVGHLGLADPAAIVDGTVLRVQKAYPVYDATYCRGIAATKRFLAEVPNLQLVGRNGMHHYNNQDHSMLTAILAARNILGARYDLWQVNVDSDYQEQDNGITNAEIQAMEASQPLVPERVFRAG